MLTVFEAVAKSHILPELGIKCIFCVIQVLALYSMYFAILREAE